MVRIQILKACEGRGGKLWQPGQVVYCQPSAAASYIERGLAILYAEKPLVGFPGEYKRTIEDPARVNKRRRK